MSDSVRTTVPGLPGEALASVHAEGLLPPRKRRVECSASPTGPLHFAHGRHTAVADSLETALSLVGRAASHDHSQSADEPDPT